MSSYLGYGIRMTVGVVGMGSKFQFVKMKTFWRWLVVMLHNSVNVLNATELYT